MKTGTSHRIHSDKAVHSKRTFEKPSNASAKAKKDIRLLVSIQIPRIAKPIPAIQFHVDPMLAAKDLQRWHAPRDTTNYYPPVATPITPRLTKSATDEKLSEMLDRSSGTDLCGTFPFKTDAISENALEYQKHPMSISIMGAIEHYEGKICAKIHPRYIGIKFHLNTNGCSLAYSRDMPNKMGTFVRYPHPSIEGGTDPSCYAAGSIVPRLGKILAFRLDSGHYKPDYQAAQKLGEFLKHLPPSVFHESFKGIEIFTGEDDDPFQSFGREPLFIKPDLPQLTEAEEPSKR